MISVIIPTYNRGDYLPQVTKRLLGYLEGDFSSFEVIIIDDGSKDNTKEVVKHLCRQYEDVRGIIMANNYGQQNATLAGIRQAKYPTVLTMDDDLRYGLEGIRDLVNGLDQGYDVVYGVPDDVNTLGLRPMGTWLKELIFRSLCHKPKGVKLTSFRALKGPVIGYIKKDQTMNVYLSARTLQFTDRISNVKVTSHESLDLPTNYTFKKLLVLLIQVFRNYSRIGLKLKLNQLGHQYAIEEIYP